MPKRKGRHEGNRLTPAFIRNLDTSEPGLHWDGHGLALQVSKYGTAAWLFIYSQGGKPHKLGLGPLHSRSLAQARKKAAEIRLARLDGVDPLDHKRMTQAKAKIEAAKTITFRQSAEAYMEAHRKSWKNDKHAAQWPATLTTYAYPIFGDLPVQSIDVALVTRALESIWRDRTETASRLRGRIEAVLDWATVRGYRHGDNPARWRGHLDKLLPARAKVQRVEHHAALPVADVPAFMSELRLKDSTAARALEFTVLTAARLGEMLGAKWDEIDLAGKAWNIPGERMKSGRAHVVPLSPRAVMILEGLPRTGDRVYSVSAVTVQRLMGAMRPGMTIHGCRSSFRDWAGDMTTFPRELAEQALAHVIGDKAEQAYRRGDALERRRALMSAWSAYCEREPAGDNVVAIGAGRVA
jgi:integrase